MEGIAGNIFFFDWEVRLIEWIQGTIGPFGDKVAQFFSFLGGETMMLVLILGLVFCYSKEAGKRCAMITMAASMWFPMIKNVALRLRPYMAHDTIRVTQLAEADAAANDIIQQGYSFPSGHAATSVTIYGSIAREVKKKWLWIVTVVIVLFIGISRFAVGVHYPTDVLAGWAVGLLAFGFGSLLEKKVEKEWVRHLILVALTVPGLFWCRSRDYFSALGILIGMVLVFPYEKKYVNFEDTRNPAAMVLRVVGAMAVYFALNTVLKLPFSSEFLNDGTVASGLVRSARYMIIIMVEIGVYPRVFPLFEKVRIGKAK